MSPVHPLKNYTTELNWRDTTSYAIAIEDQNPLYFNDESEKGLGAHPMHSVAVTWPILGKIWEFIDSDDFPIDLLMTQVHYTEHLIIHRLMRPGDKLNITGSITAIDPRKSGTHSIAKLEAVDETGSPVFTEYSGALLRGVKCADKGKGMDNDYKYQKKDVFFLKFFMILYNNTHNLIVYKKKIHYNKRFD